MTDYDFKLQKEEGIHGYLICAKEKVLVTKER